MARDDLTDQLMSLDGPALRTNESAALSSSGLITRATKAEANYRLAEEGDETETPRECGGCIHFIKSGGSVDGTCEEVVGRIFHEYVCDYFADDGEDDNKDEKG